jgi:RHS repeat-associated protein
VTNENGRQLSLTYASNRVATLITPDGTFSYAYDGNGNLDEVTRPDTKTREYHYENTTYVNALTGITDEAGARFATYDYDANGKAILSEHAGSVDDYTVTYNVDGTTTVTNPLGKDTTYHFTNILGVRKVVQVDGEASTNCVASNRYYNYDARGRVIGKTDWENNTTRFDYDARGNITTITEASGTPQQRVKTITYDATWNLPDLITEPGRTTDYAYDAYGRVTSMTVTDTATAATRVTTYTYHANTTDGSGNTVLGRLATVDGPRTDVSDVTEYDYDANLNLTKITNALGQETQITARDAAGRPATIEDANGVETDLVYDGTGHLTTSTVAPGTALEAETAYTYDANGNLTQVTLPNGATVDYSYDAAQRLTGIEDALGNTVAYTLDAAGNITKEEYKDSGSTLKYVHNQVFDELSRLLESVGASAQTDTYAYDKNSNLTAFTDANTNATSYAYDPLQRLVTSTDALSGVTETTYTALDDLASVKDQRTNTTTYTYNAFGDVTGETSPDRGTIAYTVDKAGNVTQRTDARSIVTNYTWDALNRLTSVAYPSDSSLDATLTYDLTSGCGTAGIGHLCSVTDASGTTAYEYNALGQLAEVNETRGGLTFTTAYTYDLAGNVLTATLPSGRTITYTRNANGQASGVSAVISGSSVNLASSITYLPFGPLNALTYGNSRTFSATYDQDYNPTNRTVSTIYNHTYDTDDNGNIIQIGSTDYGYDALNRLDEEDSGSAVTYTYDATSNRLTKISGGTTSTTVPSTSNKISAVGGTSYTYDAAGNVTAIGTQSYVWNAAGQMKEAKVSGSTVGAYTYDSQNRRVKKVAGGNTTHYVYGLNGLLYGEYDNSGNLIREYVYLDDLPAGALAQVDAGSPEVLTYLHTDHLGTPRFATNTGGTQVWAWTSDAFGNGAPSGAATVNLRMPGQYYDAESGLSYNWNRYYNPATGRYISSDPIGLEGGLNTFLYAEASPVMYSDPEGLQGLRPIPFPTPISLFIELMKPTPLGNSTCYQNGINVCSTTSSMPSTSVAQPKVCTLEDTGNPDGCEKYYKDIETRVNNIKRRYAEMREDKYDQYNKAYAIPDPNSPTQTTWIGHRDILRQEQQGLRNAIRRAEAAGCYNYHSNAWYWASIDAPTKPAP